MTAHQITGQLEFWTAEAPMYPAPESGPVCKKHGWAHKFTTCQQAAGDPHPAP